MFDQITRRNLKRVLDDPSLLVGEMNSWAVDIDAWFQQRLRRNRGVDVMAEDWDNLVIVDGCRYDVFKRRNTIDGRLERRRSFGSQSWEFMRENFADEEFHDTVYVSANPYTNRLGDDVFHRVVELYEEGWNEEYETVLPETVVQAALDAFERAPNKRFIIHFMQPHIPFIGETGCELSHLGLAHDNLDTDPDDGRYPVWENLRYGFTDVSVEDVWEAYCENLDIVLPYVETILNELGGRSVVTSDHGNLFGERLWPIPVRGYGHPAGIRRRELVDVPWVIVKDGERREVVAEPPVGRDPIEEGVVADRLRDLGYVE